MDLSKVFDCIPHDLIIARLAANGIERQTLRLIYSYLEDGKQCVKINSTYSDYNEIISGVQQGSILEPILFNLSISYLFLFIEIDSMHNFADDNTLSAWGETVFKSIDTLEWESNTTINWFTKKKWFLIQTNHRLLFLMERNPILQTFR